MDCLVEADTKIKPINHTLTSTFSKFLQADLLKELPHGNGQSVQISCLDDRACIADDFTDRSTGVTGPWVATRHRFTDAHSECFILASVDEQVDGVHERFDRLKMSQPPEAGPEVGVLNQSQNASLVIFVS